MKIRATIRYYIQRWKLRNHNCTKCEYFTTTNQCVLAGLYFLRYVALVTNCHRFIEKRTL